MKKSFILTVFVTLFVYPSTSFAHEFSLFIKPCKSCEWLTYSTPFRLKEQCEIARQGIFIQGMTKCLKTD